MVTNQQSRILHVESLPSGFDGAQEELRAVGVGSGVGHREDSGSSVLQVEVFILELGAVDRFTSSSVAPSEVTPLTHEVGNDTVENGSLVSFAFLTGAQGAEVLGRLRNDVGAELQTVEKRVSSSTHQTVEYIF